MAAHLSTLLHATVLPGLVWAAWLSTLGPGWTDVAAGLVIAASALVAAKDTVNWRTSQAGRSCCAPTARSSV